MINKEINEELKTISIGAQIKLLREISLIPNQKELEYLKQTTTEAYTITGLYSISRINAMAQDKKKFEEEVNNLKQILITYGVEGIFTPVISKKAINENTNKLIIRLQKAAGLKRITILEANINESAENMQTFFAECIKNEKIEKVYPILDSSMHGTSLLTQKLSKLKEIGITECGLHFAGYWKYQNNWLQLLALDKQERPNILLSGIWEKIGKTPLPVLMSLFNIEGVSVGFKWGGKLKKNKPIQRLNELNIAYYSIGENEAKELKKEIKVASNEELYKYIRAENYNKNKRIIAKLAKLESAKLAEEVKDKESLNFFFN